VALVEEVPRYAHGQTEKGIVCYKLRFVLATFWIGKRHITLYVLSTDFMFISSHRRPRH